MQGTVGIHDGVQAPWPTTIAPVEGDIRKRRRRTGLVLRICPIGFSDAVAIDGHMGNATALWLPMGPYRYLSRQRRRLCRRAGRGRSGSGCPGAVDSEQPGRVLGRWGE